MCPFTKKECDKDCELYILIKPESDNSHCAIRYIAERLVNIYEKD